LASKYYLLAQGLDNVAVSELAPASGLNLAIHLDLTPGQDHLGIGARINESSELKELAETNDIVSDLDRAWLRLHYLFYSAQQFIFTL